MANSATKLSIRFGTGLSPRFTAPSSPSAILEDLKTKDHMQATFPLWSMTSTLNRGQKYRSLSILRRANRLSSFDEELFDTYLDQLRADRLTGLRTTFARGLDAPIGFRERLVGFWADHFSVVGRTHVTRALVAIYVDEAIRANLAGRFSDMLIAAVLHPVMLLYLDQQKSVGPNSSFAKIRIRRGLNENLAREVLELHTLGVGSAYTQTDVHELAKLLTGLSGSPHQGFRFRTNWAEPGFKEVLGLRYGGGEPALSDIKQALEDLATHPDTARHIARKLAVHFVADDPPQDLVMALERAYRDADGDLGPVYETLLNHSAASAPLTKARQPYDYMVAAFRSLGVTGDAIMSRSAEQLQSEIMDPLQSMGQSWQRPGGPNGWPEDASYWFTPQGLAARITWALDLRKFSMVDIPDPREHVQTALGELASSRLALAASAAESRADGVAIVLASPEFQRR